MEGQITPNSRFGKWIRLTVRHRSVRTIVEIGTWNGLGSTAIIAGAIEGKPEKAAWSLESNQAMFKEALRNLGPQTGLKLVHGRLVSEADLDSEGLTELEQGWFAQDVVNLRDAPIASDQIPGKIDVLLLDGGEFSTWAEFVALKDRATGFILLDDTRVRKNRRVNCSLRSDPDWLLLASGRLRNGWAVWARRGRFSLIGLRLIAVMFLAQDQRAIRDRLANFRLDLRSHWGAYRTQITRHGIVPLRFRRPKQTSA